METGGPGLYGEFAARPVEEGLKLDPVSATILPLQMEEPIALAVLLSPKLATLRLAQLRIRVSLQEFSNILLSCFKRC